MQIVVNGDSVEVEEGLTVAALLERIGKSTEHVAVECNGKIVDARDFATLPLRTADKLEIVHFVGGG